MSEQEDRIIRMDAVTLATGLSVATINRKEKAGDFPQRLKIGTRAVGWRLSAVQQWVEKQKENCTYSAPIETSESSITVQGRIKFFCLEKGFGFVRNPEGDVFIHISELPNLYQPMPGDLIEYATKQTRKGTVATHIKLISRSDKYRHLDSASHLPLETVLPMQDIGGNCEQ